MPIKDPQRDLPRGLRGGAETWDQPQASVLLAADYFAEPAPPPSGPATLLGVEVLTLSTTNTTPGAQSITVPSGTQGVVVMARANSEFLTLTSSFAGTWTNVPPSSGVERLLYAPVTATGAQTITPNWGSFLAEGPVFFIFYVGNIDNSAPASWVRAAATGEVNSQAVASETTDLVFGVDSAVTETAALPGNEAGWTSLATSANGNLSGRARQADSPGSPTTTINRQRNGTATDFHGLGIISIIGASGGGAFDLPADGGTFTYTAGDAGIQYGRQLAADGGEYAFAGGDAALTVGRQVAADGASYTYTAGDAGLTATRQLAADGAAYTYAGGDAELLSARTIAADGGEYAFTGGAADLTLTGATAFELLAEGASFAFTGGESALTAGRTLIAEGGAFAFSGGAADLLYSRTVSAEGGVYAFTGGAADLSLAQPGSFELLADGGGFAFTGGEAEITVARVVGADGAEYAFSGGDASLEDSGRLLFADGGSFVFSGGDAALILVGGDADQLFPLQGQQQSFPTAGASQNFPLGGQSQTFPLG